VELTAVIHQVPLADARGIGLLGVDQFNIEQRRRQDVQRVGAGPGHFQI